MKKQRLLLWTCAVIPLSGFAALPDDGVTFVAHGPYAAGAAAVEPANGGMYVYSSMAVEDGRRSTRFMLGQPARQTYDLFSAEEEAALYEARAEKLSPVGRGRGPLHHLRFHPPLKLNWPRVVIAGDRTCVPQLTFANSADWKEHLVCWSAGDSRVE